MEQKIETTQQQWNAIVLDGANPYVCMLKKLVNQFLFEEITYGGEPERRFAEKVKAARLLFREERREMLLSGNPPATGLPGCDKWLVAISEPEKPERWER